jgi:hypothetical protein
MKIRLPKSILSLVAAFVFSAGLMAQENTEVSIVVKKDGKVVKDTTYQFDSADEAKHAMKMMEVMSGMDEDMEKVHYNYTMAHSGGKHANAMVFISEDGEKTEIKEMHGDSLVWISEGEGLHKEHMHGEHVVVVKTGDGETFDIIIDKDGDTSVKKTEIKVLVSGDEDGSWTVVEGGKEISDEDGNVFIIKGDDEMKVELKKIMKEHEGVEGENVKVIVIKKSGDLHEEHDEDHDEDTDHDEDVEVKVVKKKVKK